MLRLAAISDEAAPAVAVDPYNPVAVKWPYAGEGLPLYWFTGEEGRSLAEIALHPQTGQIVRFVLVFADPDLWTAGDGQAPTGAVAGVPCFGLGPFSGGEAGAPLRRVTEPGPIAVRLGADSVTVHLGPPHDPVARVIRSGRVEAGFLASEELAWIRVSSLRPDEMEVLGSHREGR
jgi:hypothetical protein